MQTLRPASTVSAGAWTASAGTLHDTQRVESKAAFINHPDSASVPITARFALDAGDTPDTGTRTLRIGCARLATNRAVTILARLYEGTTEVGSLSVVNPGVTHASGDIATGSIEITDAISDYGNLFVEVEVSSKHSAGVGYVYYVALDIPDAGSATPAEGTGSMSGGGTLLGIGLAIAIGVGSLSGGGSLSGVGEAPPVAAAEGQGTISGGGTLAGIGEAPAILPNEGTGTLSGGGSLLGVGEAPAVAAAEGTGALSGGGTLVGIGQAPTPGVAEGTGRITGSGALSGIGEAPAVAMAEGTGVLSGGGSLTGIGVAPVPGAMEGTGRITGGGSLWGVGEAPAVQMAEGVGVLSGGGSLSGIGEAPIPEAPAEGVGRISGGGTLTGIGAVTHSGTGNLTGGGVLSGIGSTGDVVLRDVVARASAYSHPKGIPGQRIWRLYVAGQPTHSQQWGWGVPQTSILIRDLTVGAYEITVQDRTLLVEGQESARRAFEVTP